jgi:ABC-2 type transport system ATP-binding protein
MSSPITSDPPIDTRQGQKSPTQKEVIGIEGVSVRYRMLQERVTTFKEYALRWMRGKNTYTHFLALRDITMSILKGDTVGIIGANGAGKSTLLKVIAGILIPTSGRADIHGSVAPILELGSVFDAELTGRENIYLNGAMLGHSRRTMDRKMDSLLDFAGIGDFIDSPLRNYSDGMVARLAFAIATDVDADILLIDEILAVGDKDFQQKCIDRISTFKERGITLVIVSHDLGQIERLCSRVIWLEHGKVREDGKPSEILPRYMQESAHSILDDTQVQIG